MAILLYKFGSKIHKMCKTKCGNSQLKIIAFESATILKKYGTKNQIWKFWTI